MDYAIVWSERAMTGLRQVVEEVAHQNPGAAHRLVNGLFNAVQSLRETPRKGRKYLLLDREDVRELTGPSHRLVYLVRDDPRQIAVLAITRTEHFDPLLPHSLE